jgi:cephalosporin-C deacetylase-like acetyl esterase
MSGLSTTARKRLLRTGVVAAFLGILVLAFFWAGEAYQERDYLPYFLERKGQLISAIETPLDPQPDGELSDLKLVDDRGLEVGAVLKLPRHGEPPHPVLLTLGGARTGRRTVDYLGNTGNFIVLAMDYPYHGKRTRMSRVEFLTRVPQMRRAVLDTVPATSLGVDYLYERDDVDRERIVLAAGSFGALFAPAVAAADERVRALALFFGAGDLETLVETNLDARPPVHAVASWLGSTIVSPMEPLKYIHRVAPRPIFMLNGTDDPSMPEHCSRALYERAGEPKTIRWMSMGHVDVRAEEFHTVILSEFLVWLVEIGYVSSEEARIFLHRR